MGNPAPESLDQRINEIERRLNGLAIAIETLYETHKKLLQLMRDFGNYEAY